jgi:ABC-type polysaccharide/polyol phosphate export permease
MPIVWVVFGISLSTNMLLVFPGMALVFLNQFWVAIVIAVLATRFSDVVQIVSSAIQISMFATPIMWPLSVISDHRFIADFNPLYHLIQLVRMPMLGQAPEVLSWIVVLGMNGAGYLFAAWLLGRVRHRIVYWL